MKQCTRWWGRKEDQGAAQAACVVGLLRRGARKRATACGKRKAAWRQEKWALRTHQIAKLTNCDVDVVDALTAVRLWRRLLQLQLCLSCLRGWRCQTGGDTVAAALSAHLSLG